ncbi:MAG: hypothetical protein QXO67_02370 [Candidatus Bathyarchaeia archaeon]
MQCKACKYEIEQDEPVYCQTCFETLMAEAHRLQKENETLKNEIRNLKNRLEIERIEKNKWRRKKWGRKWLK